MLKNCLICLIDFSSSEINSAKPIESDQIYFLPTANILINATAKIAITKQLADSLITGVEIYDILFENTIQLQADSEQMFSLHYKPNWMSSDEIKLATSSLGLLDSLSITAEDRFSQTLSH